MYDIRVSKFYLKKIQKCYNESSTINKDIVTIHEDPAVSKEVGAIIMIKDDTNTIKEWGFRGVKMMMGFIKLGYFPNLKKCPLIHKQCIGIKCSLFIVHKGVGDCSFIWSAINSLKTN